MGLKYNGNAEAKDRNLLIAYADSSFTLPRSQGCRLIMMNSAAICFSSKDTRLQMIQLPLLN